MILQTITVLIIVGVFYLGLIQVFRFIRMWYFRLVAFYKDLKVFLRSRKDGNRVMAINIREVAGSVSGNELVHPNTKPVAEPLKEELVSAASGIADNTASNDTSKNDVSQGNEIPEETLFISLNMAGKEYNGSDDVSADELMVMNRTLFGGTATPQDEITTVKTLYKLRNTVLFDELNAAAGKEIKGLFDELTAKASKIKKSTGYDYSRHLKNKTNEQTD